MDSLAEQVAHFIRTHGAVKNCLLAYSGGMDSHVLLHLFAALRSTHSFHLRAMYINHGIHSDADQWAAHCARVCHELNVEFLQQSIPVLPDRENLEEKLRQQRYQLLKNALGADEILLTAHHQNDQAETVLLQLCRGAGLSGLAAMPQIKQFGPGWHARPLLECTRDDLLEYAILHKLNWIEDESNSDLHHARNFLRHEIMPILAKRWPAITKTFARSAENCADAKRFIALSVQQSFSKVQGTVAGTLSVKKLLLLEPAEQRHIFRSWIEQAGFLLPSIVKMQQIMQTLLYARDDKMPHVYWGEAEIRRYRDDLFLMKKLALHDADQKISWDLSQVLHLPSVGVLEALPVQGKGLRADISHVTVQFRQGGEMLRLPGRKHHHALKKMFQVWGVLPWLRDRIPLVYVDGVLAVVVGYWVAEECVANDNACIIQLQPEPNFATVASYH